MTEELTRTCSLTRKETVLNKNQSKAIHYWLILLRGLLNDNLDCIDRLHFLNADLSVLLVGGDLGNTCDNLKEKVGAKWQHQTKVFVLVFYDIADLKSMRFA